eukprot:4621583-Pyramimonas_sp.AAC.1
MRGSHWEWAVRYPLACPWPVSASTDGRKGSVGSRCAADLYGARTSVSACVALCDRGLLSPAWTPPSTSATAVPTELLPFAVLSVTRLPPLHSCADTMFRR